ncbi:triphosphoribosyl-dephospho-CoA synthase MdcB [Lichenicoccus sp.]|uniref:triphosphoribosyl-dephospho-CoA synthase MdcB n=1 Tax=Lichenicoccus sp. TaxID=2781899 RepID=UPI003D0F5F89
MRKGLAPARIGALAEAALLDELDTWPKPGLVTPRDRGSHVDMDHALLAASARVLRPFFASLAEAGAAGAGLDALRRIGRAAEAAMLAATDGVNTHRGAIFSIGLLTAAAGSGRGHPAPGGLGTVVRRLWGPALLAAPAPRGTHGAGARRRHGAAGALIEAAHGFSSIYQVGLPALRDAREAGKVAARVQACFALIATIEDTNLLHRGGAEGLAYARGAAASFLAAGGVRAPGWLARAEAVHADFVARRLSPGGSADLLAATLFVDRMECA